MSVILLLIALLAAWHFETDEACRQKMDLCLALDGSSTVCDGNETCENWEFALQFYKNITTTLEIGNNKYRVAFVTFFNATEVTWNLTRYTAMNPLLSAIGGVAFEGGVFTDLTSVNVIVSQLFNPVYGDNLLLKNVLIAVLDGVPNVSTAEGEATSLGVQKYGITVFVVCVMPRCTEEWAKALASKPSKANLTTYFLVDSYSSLNNALRDTVLEQICYFLEDPPLLPTPIVKINVNLTVG